MRLRVSSRKTTVSAALLALAMISTSGCASLRGERVESGMGSTQEIDLEPGEAAADAEDTTTSTSISSSDGTVPDELASSAGTAEPGGIGVVEYANAPQLPPAAVSAASADSFNFFAPELFSGAPVSGPDLYETGPVVVTFLSPTCPVSVAEAPSLAEAAELDPEITYVFVHTGADRAAYLEYVEYADLYQQNAIHIDDTDLTLWNRFDIQVQPSTVLVHTSGAVTVSTGGLDHEGLANAARLVMGI